MNELSKKRWSRLLSHNEFYIAIIIVAICMLIEIRSGQFFTPNNLVDIIRSGIVPCIFGIGVLVVMLSGGIDLSFVPIAALAMYITNSVMIDTHFSGSIVVPFLIAGGIGIACGALNAIVISKFNLPTMIVTLGTSSVFTGLLRGVFEAKEKTAAPILMKLGDSKLFTAQNAESGLTSDMPSTLFILVGVVIVTFVLLRYTTLGRGIYAVGGDRNAARRAGFRVTRIQFFVYCYVGLLAGIAGVTRTGMSQAAHFTSLLGTELTIIAATVLGGARITGGVGTITGTILGAFLMTIVSNSLVLIGVPTYWQQFFTGALIVIGTGISVYQASKKYRGSLNLDDQAKEELG